MAGSRRLHGIRNLQHKEEDQGDAGKWILRPVQVLSCLIFNAKRMVMFNTKKKKKKGIL
jgi:hypothetical protein